MALINRDGKRLASHRVANDEATLTAMIKAMQSQAAHLTWASTWPTGPPMMRSRSF